MSDSSGCANVHRATEQAGKVKVTAQRNCSVGFTHEENEADEVKTYHKLIANRKETIPALERDAENKSSLRHVAV